MQDNCFDVNSYILYVQLQASSDVFYNFFFNFVTHPVIFISIQMMGGQVSIYYNDVGVSINYINYIICVCVCVYVTCSNEMSHITHMYKNKLS